MMMMMASCMTSPVIEVVVLSDKDLVLGGSTVPIYKKFDDVELVVVVVDGCDGGCGGGDDVTGNNGWWSILRIAGNGPSLDSKLFPGLLDSNSLRSS
ncbi:hypothetical protein Tco_1196685 [Tanacetum coccineum]